MTQQYITCENAAKQLQSALDSSTELMETEYYSMRLVSEAMGRAEGA